MNLIMFFILSLSIAFICLNFYLIAKTAEYLYCAKIRRQPPLVASSNRLRQMVVDEIKKHYRDAKNICDLGAGFGGMARFIAKNTNANVVAFENMPLSVAIAKFMDIFARKNKTIWCDLFKYLDENDEVFDVGVAYLGPKSVQKLQKYSSRFLVIISLDFEITGAVPVRIIDASKYGYTMYNGKKYPHKLFVYEFK